MSKAHILGIKTIKGVHQQRGLMFSSSSDYGWLLSIKVRFIGHDAGLLLDVVMK